MTTNETDVADQDGPYLVWSNEHRAWWRTGSMGYTVDISQAGFYSRREALDIVAGATIAQDPKSEVLNELPVRVVDLPIELRIRLVP